MIRLFCLAALGAALAAAPAYALTKAHHTSVHHTKSHSPAKKAAPSKPASSQSVAPSAGATPH